MCVCVCVYVCLCDTKILNDLLLNLYSSIQSFT